MAKAPRKEIGYEERKRTHDLSTNTDYNAEMEMSYAELVEHLLSKYGSSKEDYFTNESCSTPNPLAKRSKEGLICHHIDEDKVANLSNKEVAINNPYDYQKADRLVYCNLLEHLLLHITITLEVPHSLERKRL